MRRGRPFEVEWREGDTADALKAAYLGERDGGIRSRLQALWLLREGRTLGDVTGALGVHYRSVQRWVAWYRQGGLALLRSRQKGGVGQTPFLSTQAQEEVAREVAKGRFRTGQEITAWINQTYGTSYRVGSVYNLLARLRCAPKVPRPLHARTDQEQQETWKKGA
jgi:putative transposase